MNFKERDRLACLRRTSALVLTMIVVALPVASVSTASIAYAGVLAWGSNTYGELGRESPAESDVPLPVNELTEVTAVSAAARYNLALLSNGEVVAWGSDGHGYLGDGRKGHKIVSYSPVHVHGLSEVVAISASHGTSMALQRDGHVVQWGVISPHSFSDVPVKVNGLQEVIAISAGQLHNLALLSNGSVMAWGKNNKGELGDGTYTTSYTPVEVKGLPEPAIAIAAGDVDSLVLLRNGTVMSFGNNEFGQLGYPHAHRINVPKSIPGLSKVTAISAGAFHNLALLSNGTVMSWGLNGAGELGDGPPTGPERCGHYGCSKTPVPVSGLSGVAAISADSGIANVEMPNEYSLALLKNGHAMAWGGNESGQLGDGTTTSTYAPTEVDGLTEASAISAGGLDGLALTGSP